MLHAATICGVAGGKPVQQNRHRQYQIADERHQKGGLRAADLAGIGHRHGMHEMHALPDQGQCGTAITFWHRNAKAGVGQPQVGIRGCHINARQVWHPVLRLACVAQNKVVSGSPAFNINLRAAQGDPVDMAQNGTRHIGQGRAGPGQGQMHRTVAREHSSKSLVNHPYPRQSETGRAR